MVLDAEFAEAFGKSLVEFSFATHSWPTGRDLEVAIRNALAAYQCYDQELLLIARRSYNKHSGGHEKF